MAKAKAKATRILKSLILPLCTKLPNIKTLMLLRKNNKVGPILANNYRKNETNVLLSDGRRDGEYLQARRAILNSYHLSDDTHTSLMRKMKSSLEGFYTTRVGVGVCRFTMGCPWSSDDVLVLRCFVPHVKCTD